MIFSYKLESFKQYILTDALDDDDVDAEDMTKERKRERHTTKKEILKFYYRYYNCIIIKS